MVPFPGNCSGHYGHLHIFYETLLLTHTFSLDEIKEGYRVFGERLDGALKVAIKP
jgi:threonine dehydrogenase-like Zn-dependent dehydrogenase